MKSSRYYQTAVQIIGSFSEVILFLAGFFLGKEMFIVAALLVGFRIINKITISEFMYRRFHAQIKEGVKFPGKGGT
jgi:hypothetical protein